MDFHSFLNVLSEKTEEGKGLQDLKHIGDRIVHAAAFTEPPVNLGNRILPGSTFKNGEITLAFKGLGLWNGVPCALIGYDSGESAFTMLMKPLPDMNFKAVGRSHYFGDMQVDLKSGWPLRVDMTEWVITQVEGPALPGRIHQVIERRLWIDSISKEAFER